MLPFHAVARFRDLSEALCDDPGRRNHGPIHAPGRRAAIPPTAR